MCALAGAPIHAAVLADPVRFAAHPAALAVACGGGTLYRRIEDIAHCRGGVTVPSVVGMELMTEQAARSFEPTLDDRPCGRPVTTILLAAGLAAGLWLLAVPGLGVDLSVAEFPGGPVGDRTVGLGSVISSTIAAGLAGWGLLALLNRWTRGGSRVWTWIAVAVTVLSLGAPLTMAGSAVAALTLGVLHVVVGAVLVPGLTLPTGNETRR